MTFRYWTTGEIGFLRRNYAEMSWKELADALGRTVGSIHKKAFEMRLRKRHDWTKKVRDEYTRLVGIGYSYYEIAFALNLSIHSVKKARIRHNLPRPTKRSRYGV